MANTTQDLKLSDCLEELQKSLDILKKEKENIEMRTKIILDRFDEHEEQLWIKITAIHENSPTQTPRSENVEKCNEFKKEHDAFKTKLSEFRAFIGEPK